MIWTLLPEQKMYVEIEFDKAKARQYAAEKSADLPAAQPGAGPRPDGSMH